MTSRLLGLDVLRGIAALSVVFFHYTTNFGNKFGHSGELLFSLPNGYYGVHLFFVISGFVILMTLDRVSSLGAFAFSRFSRLYPAYWAAVLCTYAFVTVLGLPGKEADVETLAMNFTMLQRYFGYDNIDHVYWTLKAELSFYVAMGVVVWLGLRRQVHWIFIGLMLLHVFLQQTGYHNTVPGLWRSYDLLPLEYIYLFAMGLMIYELRDGWRPEFWLVIPLAAVNAALAGVGDVATLALSSLLVLLAVRYPVRLYDNRFLLYLGAISYTLYLLHANIGYAVLLRLQQAGVEANPAIAMTIVLSLLLATLCTYLVERPAMQSLRAYYRRRREKRDSDQDPDAPVLR